MTSTTDESQKSSYIDYATFTSPTFSPTLHANSLILSTNNPSDTPLDLSTPLSRILFDVQEIDTHIDALTTKHALPIITHTQTRSEASARLLSTLEAQVQSLNESYARLESEVGKRYEAAEQVRQVAQRLNDTLRVGRAVQRVVTLARQLEGLMEDLGNGLRESSSAAAARGVGGSYRSMVPAATTMLALRGLFNGSGEDGTQVQLGKINVVNSLRQDVVGPAERVLLSRAQQVVREFSMSSLVVPSATASSNSPTTGAVTGASASAQTFAQTEEMKSRATSALQTLYLLSPIKATTATGGINSNSVETFEPTLLLSALQSYLQTALTSSLAALSRALATLPTLDRALLEISARCQNIVALEALLEGIRPPTHPLLRGQSDAVEGAAGPHDTAAETPSSPTSSSIPQNFLTPLLRHLDTASLPSYFWRSMAGQMSSRVQEILVRGGVSARTLRTNRDRVRDAIRECVDRGSRIPVSGLAGRKDGKVGNWEREAAVMVQSVVGPLQR